MGKLLQAFVLLLFLFGLTLPAAAQKACFTSEARAQAERPPKSGSSPTRAMTRSAATTQLASRAQVLPQ